MTEKLAQRGKWSPGGALLANGRYWSVFSRRGTGVAFARWNGDWLQTYGWRPEVVDDASGWLFYLRDRNTGFVWSPAPAPCPHTGGQYRFWRRQGRSAIECRTPELYTELTAWVDSTQACEFRWLHLRNVCPRTLEIDVTTYLEVVLFPFAAFAAHPAFAKLFVQTEWLPNGLCLVARRRARSSEERWPLFFLAARTVAAVEYETDRMSFIGRGRNLHRPRALVSAALLSGNVGNVLDPALSMRQVLVLPPGGVADLEFVCGVAGDEASLRQTLQKPAGQVQRAVSLEDARRGHGQLLRATGLRLREARRAEELAVCLLYRSPDLRVRQAVEAEAAASVQAKLEIDASRRLFVVDEQADQALWERIARYWTITGVPIDVAFVHCCSNSVMVRHISPAGSGSDLTDLSSSEYRALLACADGCARIQPKGHAGSRRVASRTCLEEPERIAQEPSRPPVELWNGFGGFCAGGKEYAVYLVDGRFPPLPWVNVIANPEFGCLVSERGIGWTWSRNSREFRLTAWSNDPVVDPPSECLYFRDERSGEFWSPLPAPWGRGTFVVTHGQGFTRWEQRLAELDCTVTCFVAADAAVRVVWVELVNKGTRARKLSLWAYHRLVLGAEPWAAGRYVVTEFDSTSGILWARNPAVRQFADRVVFAALVSSTPFRRIAGAGDRVWFLGRGGSLELPGALRQRGIRDGPTGAGYDPAAILVGEFVLHAGQRWQGGVLLGEAASKSEAQKWVEHYRLPGALRESFAATEEFWASRLSHVRVETPWRDLDMLVNHWLLYQATSCRLWGRSAFYQSGGAFGFRDQLQDACALLWSRPQETRAQILLHAAHQFPEGDVLHWWHPPWEKGTRTRFSDDLLWLPWVTATYVTFTGDREILDEQCPFVRARALRPGEDEAYLHVERSEETATLYDHCCRAIDRSLTVGSHGLPLMGTGDWNDGMNRVGRGGRGESVWLGFFLVDLLQRFVPLSEARGDRARVQRYRAFRQKLIQALETHGWDGAWYRRAYFDDGTPLGSAQNSECQIDALVQAWAVLSGVALPERALRALSAVEEKLVDSEGKIIRLLAPPFDRMPHDPGYIKGYVPGIRENGGQYTHAAIWVVQAFFRAGLCDRGAELLRYLLPTEHSGDAASAQRYRVEPYVVVADIYSVDPHRGRGGWTWYTGSAGWLYRLVLETLLGVTLDRGETLIVNPSIPTHWPGFRVRWCVPGIGDVYQIELEQVGADPDGSGTQAYLDGKPLLVSSQGVQVPLVRDGGEHEVTIRWVRRHDHR